MTWCKLFGCRAQNLENQQRAVRNVKPVVVWGVGSGTLPVSSRRGRRGECVASGRLDPTLGLGFQSPSACLRARRLRSTERAHLGLGSARIGVCTPAAHHVALPPSGLSSLSLPANACVKEESLWPPPNATSREMSTSTPSWWRRSTPPSRSSSLRAG